MASGVEEKFMRRALELARLGAGWTSPNPMVGAVIVRDGQVVGEGYHQRAGTPHAEVHALNQAGNLARGATLYVTLEPCAHFGRTPPCTRAIIQSGVSRVVAAMIDPNPLVAGQGLAFLAEAGVQVEQGLLRGEAVRLNEAFIKHITTGLPFVLLKTAMTLDGKIATREGESQWITGEEARRRTHYLRHRYDVILVGIGTVLADDPALTARLPGGIGKDPVRVIVDSKLRLPLNAKVVTGNSIAPTIVATTPNPDPARRTALEARGVEVLEIPGSSSHVDLKRLAAILGCRSITSIMIEGGAAINGSALTEGLVDKVLFFIAPKLVCGNCAPGPIGGQGFARLADALALSGVEVESLGADILVSGYLSKGGEN